MEKRDVNKLYESWLKNASLDLDLNKELKKMKKDDIYDAFYKDLDFGTAGLRGIIGAGTNRMNVYTVSLATQGVASYVLSHFKEGNRSVAISYDSRIKSDLFSKVVAEVFAANNIKVYIYPSLSPVPTLSFATRYLKTSVGIMITASHNPSKYNGYKVYDHYGCQIGNEIADEILSNIKSIDVFKDIKMISIDDAFNKGLVEYIKPDVLTHFINHVKNESLLGDEKVDKDVSIIYTPLNGTGLVPVTRALNELGYTNITVVKEQEFPNGYFPTCPYPNPEIEEAMAIGMNYASKYDADLLIATDPDADRVGIAVKDKDGKFILFSGNQTGTLLLDYICQRRIALNRMPKNPVAVKTIVTTSLAKKVADNYGVKMVEVLTGFKYIGEQIKLLEDKGEEDSYIFGFEESYGVLSGTYVRDKDAINGATLIAEMFVYYRSKGLSLLDRLDELYKKYGYTLNKTYSFEFDGEEGFNKMKNLMDTFRNDVNEIASLKVIEKIDYQKGVLSLPKSNVLKLVLEDESTVLIRPSGTEPKLKTYLSVSKSNEKEAIQRENEIHSYLASFIK